MSDLYGIAAQTTSRVSVAEGGNARLRALRDASLITANWYESMALAGRIVGANFGTVTTPLTFLVTAANRPDAWVRVPDGTAILPLSCNIVLETSAGTATEIDIRTAQNDIGNGTSTAASVGPQSLRGDSLFTSGCTARQLATADTTAETSPISVYRKTFGPISDTTTPGGLDRSVMITREMMGYPVLIGAATWEAFIAATTTQATGFVIMTWLELPESFVT